MSAKTDPTYWCHECYGPNGYHSSKCSAAKRSTAEKFVLALTVADHQLLRDLRISVTQSEA